MTTKSIVIYNAENRDQVLEKLKNDGYVWSEIFSSEKDLLSYKTTKGFFNDLYDMGYPYCINAYRDGEVTYSTSPISNDVIDAEDFLEGYQAIIKEAIREAVLSIRKELNEIENLLSEYCPDSSNCAECSEVDDDYCPGMILGAIRRLKEF